jgi:hypothetical protein
MQLIRSEDNRWGLGRDERGSASVGLQLIGDAITCSLVANEIKILISKPILRLTLAQYTFH